MIMKIQERVLERYKSHPRYTRYSLDIESKEVFGIYGKKLKLQVNHKGYLKITIRHEGFSKVCLLHRFIYEVVNRVILDPSEQINHIDGDKLNNEIDNLEVVTCQENINHAWRTGLHPVYKGDDLTQTVISEIDAEAMILDCMSGFKAKALSLKYGYKRTTCQALSSRQNWQWLWTEIESR